MKLSESVFGALPDGTPFLAMDAVPGHIDPAAVRQYLDALPGVSDIHDLHIWAMSTTEAADVLEITEDNVKVRLHRARALLRKSLYARAGMERKEAFTFHAVRCDRVVKNVFERIQKQVPTATTGPPLHSQLTTLTKPIDGITAVVVVATTSRGSIVCRITNRCAEPHHCLIQPQAPTTSQTLFDALFRTFTVHGMSPNRKRFICGTRQIALV